MTITKHARDAAIINEVKTTTQRRMAELKVPGVAIGITHNGEVAMAGFGITNIDDPQPVTERTLFYIGSATKPFTATVALTMAERGEIDLDAPIRRYLPDFQVADIEASERARVLDLFQHHTGWQGDFFDDVSSGEDALEKAVLAMRFLPQRTPYGKVFAYQNSNYIIAGRLIQAVRRAKSYEQCVMEELLVPLGMSHTSFFPAELMADRFAVGHAAVYDRTSQPTVSFSTLPRAAYPAGALITNVSDLMKWIHFQFDGKDASGQQLLSPKLLARAHSPLIRGELDEHIGIAWFVEDIGGMRVISHAGRIQGFTAKVAFAPRERFGIAVLTNGDRGIEVYDTIITQALRSYLGIEKKLPAQVPAPRSDLEPFLGMWIGDLEDYNLYWDGGQLKAQRLFKPAWAGAPKAFQNPPPISMGSAGQDLAIMTDGPYQGVIGELLRDEAGNPQLLRMQHRIFHRNSPPSP